MIKEYSIDELPGRTKVLAIAFYELHLKYKAGQLGIFKRKHLGSLARLAEQCGVLQTVHRGDIGEGSAELFVRVDERFSLDHDHVTRMMPDKDRTAINKAISFALDSPYSDLVQLGDEIDQAIGKLFDQARKP